MAGQFLGGLIAVFDAAKNERVGEARDPQADAALGLGLRFLLRQGEAADVDHIIQHAHGHAGEVAQVFLVQLRVPLKRRAHQFCKVDRA